MRPLPRGDAETYYGKKWLGQVDAEMLVGGVEYSLCIDFGTGFRDQGNEKVYVSGVVEVPAARCLSGEFSW